MNSITEQTIRLKLNNKGIPSDVAEQAAKLIAPTLEDGNVESASVALLLQSFVASYQSFPDEAIKMLEKSLITGNENKHILKKR